MSKMNANGVADALALGGLALSAVASGIAAGTVSNCAYEAQHKPPFQMVQQSPLLLNSVKTPESYLSNNITVDVDVLSLLFSETKAEAAKYVKQHADLLPTLLSARNHIKEYFPNTRLALAGNFDEAGLITGVFIGICTAFSYEESLKRLNRLDDDWIIPNISKLNNVIIDLEL